MKLKRAWTVFELLGSLLGFVWLIGPPAWQEIPRGVTEALLIVVGLCGIVGAGLLLHLAHNQRQPPYA
jgi:hypothetical protein